MGGARDRHWGAAAVLLVVTTAVSAPLGCELILGIEDIEHGTPRGACWDTKAFEGRGCYLAGEPGCPIEDADPLETHRRIINTCTPAACAPFTAELTKLLPGGGLPPVPGTSSSGGGGGMASGGAGGGEGGAGGSGGGGGGGQGGEGGAGGDAPVKCSDVLPLPRVYITGSNAVLPLLREAAPILADPSSPENLTIIYQPQSSCTGFEKIAYNERIFGEAIYFEKQGDVGTAALHTCLLDDEGNEVDIGTCDVYDKTCNTSASGGTYLDYGFGPIQAFTLVVPTASSQSVISREAAYFVYGFGGESGVSPWTDGSRIFQRDNKSGTKRMIAAAIDVPYDLWQGVVLANTSAMKGALTSAGAEGQAAADAALGILDVINDDDVKDDIKILAFQAKEQRCGFWPDAAQGAEDKRNVRDGHYVIWGPLHFFVKADNNGAISNNATAVVNYLTGFKPLPNEDKFAYTMVRTQAQGSLIPRCAMRVDRSDELGPLVPYSTDFPCGCYFEQQVTGNDAPCPACQQPSDCDTATHVCSFGFCEPK